MSLQEITNAFQNHPELSLLNFNALNLFVHYASLARAFMIEFEQTDKTMVSIPLKEYFWCGEKQNSSMYHTYCKACVAHPRARKPAVRVMEQEELLMQALALAEEDGVPDDGAIEIDLDEEFQP
ncbi:hypothetical protein DFH09DRAFT_1339909 [Mycena vulgaris]|nr:hypothetical protein DFH09DRAFT_1339909 [Mycena vulgaris]